MPTQEKIRVDGFTLYTEIYPEWLELGVRLAEGSNTDQAEFLIGFSDRLNGFEGIASDAQLGMIAQIIQGAPARDTVVKVLRELVDWIENG